GVLIAAFGPVIVPFLIVHHLYAWYGLTQANYVEHYGLLRQKLPNGRYEPTAPRHSWNTNHVYSNLISFHLQRHSDHHANALRPYQALRDFDDVPRLPSGYPGCFGLAAIPPLWFKVMDPKLLEWAGGDIGKINIDPSRRERLYEKYGPTGSDSCLVIRGSAGKTGDKAFRRLMASPEPRVTSHEYSRSAHACGYARQHRRR